VSLGGGWSVYDSYCTAAATVTVTNIPYASYDVAVLYSWGGQSPESWQLISGTDPVGFGNGDSGTISGSTFSLTNSQNGKDAFFAVQILKKGGGAPAGVLTGTPASGSDVNFGTVTAYSTGAGPTGVSVSNTGGVGCTAITVSNAVISGTDAAKFSATGTGGTLNNGDSAAYTFSFLGATANGNYSATATIGTVTYNLKATVAVAEWPGYLPGDFTEDGEVGPDDFGVLKDNFGRDGLASGNHESWTLGDATDDGEIGPDDFGVLKDNFGRDGGPAAPLTTAPEPATLALLALAGLAIRRKQR
jgi:hypothetical protein